MLTGHSSTFGMQDIEAFVDIFSIRATTSEWPKLSPLANISAVVDHYICGRLALRRHLIERLSPKIGFLGGMCLFDPFPLLCS